VNLALNGRLRRERHATHAHLTRLDKSAHFLSVARLLWWAPLVDFSLHIAILLTLLTRAIGGTLLPPLVFLGLAVAISISFTIFWPYASVLRWTSYRRAALLGIYCRFWIGFLLVWRLKDTIPVVLLLVLCGYTATWAALALFLSARTGQFTHPLLWPIMPICSLLLFARNAKAVFAKLKENWELIKASLLLVLAFGGLYYLLLNYKVAQWVFGAVSIPAMLWALPEVLSDALHWSKDWVRWHRWMQIHGVSITGQEFLESVDEYHSETWCVRFVRSVREQGVLIATEKMEILLVRLALAFEHTRQAHAQEEPGSIAGFVKKEFITAIESVRSKLKLSSKEDSKSTEQVPEIPSKPDPFDLWYAEYTRKDKWRLPELGLEFLDEICMLLEQVRANRRDRG